jgi:hypothetical protein
VELALNIGWLVLSAAICAFFVWQGVPTKGKAQNLGIACIAILCMVCLLFPVVSMTDDLNSSLAMPEATKLKRLIDLTQGVHLFSFALTLVIYAPQLRNWAALALEQQQKPADQARLYFNLNRRPPPIFQSL